MCLTTGDADVLLVNKINQQITYTSSYVITHSLIAGPTDHINTDTHLLRL